MSESVGTISYATPGAGSCPLCVQRPVTGKAIYGHRVCKKCYYAFANRRQLGYLFDALLILIPNVLITMAAVRVMAGMGLDKTANMLVLLSISAVLIAVFALKDGFNGGSPGKKLAGIQVLDEATGRPIGFGQSFKRNSFLFVGLVPYLGGLVSLVIIVVIAFQVASGYRFCDHFAGTRAIWKKYADQPMFGGGAMQPVAPADLV